MSFFFLRSVRTLSPPLCVPVDWISIKSNLHVSSMVGTCRIIRHSQRRYQLMVYKAGIRGTGVRTALRKVAPSLVNHFFFIAVG